MKKKQSPTEKKTETSDKDMMEALNISPWYSVGKLLPTSTKPKADVFNSYRPNRQCVDYKISETWTKLQGGDVKINIRETTATYEEIPEEVCKPKRKKKVRMFSGGPPQWKFIDELWKEQAEGCQKILRKEHHKMLREVTKQRGKHSKNRHEIVQRLVGPEWFMELSPKQLQAIDHLRDSVCMDLREQTTSNCKDILNSLGLVYLPNKQHIAKALRHCCRCPVEFLLVLYQIIDPKRTTYSLNDRLLLSAVVHLSITETLRELHIRIPSPPKVAEKVKKRKNIKKINQKYKYKSPYLEPLTYYPPSPQFTGIYTNKHRQYPESPYFSYLGCFKQEKRFHEGFCFNYSLLHGNEEEKAKIAEYKAAQDFFGSLPGAKQQMLFLMPPNELRLCPNLLHPLRKRSIKKNLIAPHLCKVTPSEPVICFCEENRQKENPDAKKAKRSCCEKGAQKFLQSLCLCDDCLKYVAQKDLIRIHGGFKKSPCKCSIPVPIIQGTQLNRTCECYKEYRDKIVSSAARQYLADQKFKFVVGGVIMTKFGPVYNVLTALGKKICVCGEIKQRKKHIKQIQGTLCNNEAKFAIGGIVMSKIGPVYNLAAVVARRPCRCVVSYRKKLKILEIKNKVRKNPNYFVNHGLIDGHQGPVYYFSNVVLQESVKSASELRAICSCEIKKPKCFPRCLDYVDYKISRHTPELSSDDTLEESEPETGKSTTLERGSRSKQLCSHCAQNFATGVMRTTVQKSCSSKESPCQDSSSSELETSTDESEESESSSSEETATASDQARHYIAKGSDCEDIVTPKPCRCKEELERFMKAKCPCEECNNKIRQSYATYVMGGTKTTASGNQVNLIQGVQQPLCNCMHEHLDNIRKIDEYKSRVKARYDMKKAEKKYCISGVKNTPDGPVYIISGMRPPVDCECAKAIREKEEDAEFEKQRAKMPNTGRMKYEIAGVKAMPDENIYILSRALNIPQCECQDLLARFEDAHRTCMKSFEKYLEKTEDEIKEFIEETKKLEKNSTVLNFDDIVFQAESKNAIDSSHNAMGDSKLANITSLQEIKEKESDVPQEIIEEHEKVASGSTKKAEQSKCGPSIKKLELEDDTSPSDSESSSSESSSELDISECGSCRVENPPKIKPITIPSDKTLPESLVSKRFAIFRQFPQNRKTQMKVLRHILKGMAEDGFPLAKLPQVYKLPIFKLWLELRAGVSWTYKDKLKFCDKSKDHWKHALICYQHPKKENVPFTEKEASKMTWKHANRIRQMAAKEMNNYYRKLKQVTIDTGREFFAPTYSYQFPTNNWRECAFAYLPTKEEDVFPYRIVQPHEQRGVPDNQRMHCYC